MQRTLNINSVSPILNNPFIALDIPELEAEELKGFPKINQRKFPQLSTEEEAICDLATD